ncbi:MAG: SAM-dependent methyltransferase [Hyphomicrobiales bacterium]|nr:MAG: SAM-dependent methyltransferase [Hyphomicrobiales bacterium]
MTGPECRFTQRVGTDADDARLDGAAFHRNREPIGDAVADALGGRSGDVLEIGSGTGQHVVALAERFSANTWWPTDYEPKHVESVEAWRLHAGLDNIRQAVQLDAAAEHWAAGPGAETEAAGGAVEGDLAGILVVNVLHISPFVVTRGITAGAGRRLAPGGRLMIYGPFMRDGHHTADSNRRFDQSLKSQNPAWGLRDTGVVTVIAQAAGLALVDIVQMPSNNLFLVFEKAAKQA